MEFRNHELISPFGVRGSPSDAKIAAIFYVGIRLQRLALGRPMSKVHRGRLLRMARRFVRVFSQPLKFRSMLESYYDSQRQSSFFGWSRSGISVHLLLVREHIFPILMTTL